MIYQYHVLQMLLNSLDLPKIIIAVQSTHPLAFEVIIMMFIILLLALPLRVKVESQFNKDDEEVYYLPNNPHRKSLVCKNEVEFEKMEDFGDPFHTPRRYIRHLVDKGVSTATAENLTENAGMFLKNLANKATETDKVETMDEMLQKSLYEEGEVKSVGISVQAPATVSVAVGDDTVASPVSETQPENAKLKLNFCNICRKGLKSSPLFNKCYSKSTYTLLRQVSNQDRKRTRWKSKRPRISSRVLAMKPEGQGALRNVQSGWFKLESDGSENKDCAETSVYCWRNLNKKVTNNESDFCFSSEEEKHLRGRAGKFCHGEKKSIEASFHSDHSSFITVKPSSGQRYGDEKIKVEFGLDVFEKHHNDSVEKLKNSIQMAKECYDNYWINKNMRNFTPEESRTSWINQSSSSLRFGTPFIANESESEDGGLHDGETGNGCQTNENKSSNEFLGAKDKSKLLYNYHFQEEEISNCFIYELKKVSSRIIERDKQRIKDLMDKSKKLRQQVGEVKLNTSAPDEPGSCTK